MNKNNLYARVIQGNGVNNITLSSCKTGKIFIMFKSRQNEGEKRCEVEPESDPQFILSVLNTTNYLEYFHRHRERLSVILGLRFEA